MNPWRNMERLTLADAERHNIAALHFCSSYPVQVGARRFTLQFEPCRIRYPLRLHGSAARRPLVLDLDGEALFPALSSQALSEAGDHAPRLIADSFEDWLCALEGVFGFAIELNRVSFDTAPQPGAYGLRLTHPHSGRTAHCSLHSEAVDHWLRQQPVPAGDAAALARQIVVRIPVCLAGPSLALPRLLEIRPGDALLLDRTSYHLRVPLRDGARRILLKFAGEQILIDHPILDDEKTAPDMTSEFIPIDALTFPFDALLGTLPLSLHELSRLRPGSIVSLQLPVSERAVTLLCQGVPFARGELIDLDDALAVRITSLNQPVAPGMPG